MSFFPQIQVRKDFSNDVPLVNEADSHFAVTGDLVLVKFEK